MKALADEHGAELIIDLLIDRVAINALGIAFHTVEQEDDEWRNR